VIEGTGAFNIAYGRWLYFPLHNYEVLCFEGWPQWPQWPQNFPFTEFSTNN
jgi:hypothetical protein